MFNMPHFIQITCVSIAALLGLVFNGYIMIVLLWHNQGYMKTPNNVFLLHLSLVDTVFCMILLISHSVFGAMVPTDPSPTGCNVHGFLWTLLPVVVVWTVCGLSCDRYAAISTPLHYSRLVNTRRAAIFLTAGWMLGAILALPPLLDICPYVYRDSRGACAATCTAGSLAELGYALTYVALAVVIPVFIILLCNLHIINIARYHRNRIVTAIYEVTLRAQATVTHQRNPCYLSKFKGRNAFFTIVQLVGSVTVLTVPYFTVMIWEAATGRERGAILVSMTTILFGFAPPVNAYVYGVKSRVLRHTFKFLLQRHLYKQQIDKTSQQGRPRLRRRYSAPVLSAMWDRGTNKRTLSRQFSDRSIRTLAVDRGLARPRPLDNTTYVGRTHHRPSTCSTNPLLNEPVGKAKLQPLTTSNPPINVHSTAV